MDDVPEPTVGINDVKIKIKNRDLRYRPAHLQMGRLVAKTIRTPMIIGHEYSGIVAEVGSGVKNIHVGDRVTGEGHIACGHCRNCRRGKLHVCENTIGVGVNRDGAFAEYLVIPAENVIHLDDRYLTKWPPSWIRLATPRTPIILSADWRRRIDYRRRADRLDATAVCRLPGRATSWSAI